MAKRTSATDPNIWRYVLKSRYGITPEHYDALLELQGGGCAICHKSPKKRRLGVDHNHKTGKVRGLLCWWCNYFLGIAKERKDLLAGALAYLDMYEGRA